MCNAHKRQRSNSKFLLKILITSTYVSASRRHARASCALILSIAVLALLWSANPAVSSIRMCSGTLTLKHIIANRKDRVRIIAHLAWSIQVASTKPKQATWITNDQETKERHEVPINKWDPWDMISLSASLNYNDY